MRAWHFSETAYPYLPPAETYPSIRVSLPNRIYDPEKGAALYDRYIDEWLIAEDEGVEIMLNEHHQTATCVDPAAPLMLAALARLSKKARLLILGNPIANRRQPVRVAEEMAMIDVLSHGRLEAGFVRGVPYEILPANSNPVRMNERHWEALDLIVKAWTTHDGPFSHEGRFFHHRAINIWPRCYQQPHPPIWVSTTSPGGAAAGRRARLCPGDVPDRLRRHQADLRRLSPRLARGRSRRRRADRPAGLCGADLCRRQRSAGARRRREALVVRHLEQGAAALRQPARLCAGRRRTCRCCAARKIALSAFRHGGMNVDGAIESGIMFAGTPDQVLVQIKKHYDHVGGYGQLLIMGQAGFLEHDDTVHGIRMFAREVYPRLKELYPDTLVSGASDRAAATAAR